MSKFCSECNNMLYPREEESEIQLYMACKVCEHFEIAESNLISFTNYKQDFDEIIDHNTAFELSSDPTLPRAENKVCIKCNGRRIVYYEPRINITGDHNIVTDDIELRICFICCGCYYVWK